MPINKTPHDRDTAIHEAIARRKAGDYFYTADEFITHMKTAIAEGKSNACKFQEIDKSLV